MTAVGVDGCRFGWLAVAGDGQALSYHLFRTIDELMEFHAPAERVCIDIPIGLPWKACPTRPCDTVARKHLRHRHVCVFSPPGRAAAQASDKQDARRCNQEELGRSLSEQALGIREKVAEVDAWLLRSPGKRQKVREVHPELCFWSLNKRTPLSESKATAAGVARRLALISSRVQGARDLLDRVLEREPRSRVKADDVLDALVAYLTAAVSAEELQILCGAPSHDVEGLPMEMLYPG